MIHSFVFSPSGTSRNVADTFTKEMGMDSLTHDLTVHGIDRIDIKDADDVAVFVAPVYAGRVPALAAERFMAVNGHGQKAVAIVVYGNRDYDDALVEICDLVSSRGFKIIAAGAFIAQHCIFPAVATDRPDASDKKELARFASLVHERIISGKPLDLSTVKGNRPYKEPIGVPLHPQTDKKKCNSCGTCATQCPTNAINAANPRQTDTKKCITCCRCINVCPQEARSFGGLLYKVAGWKFCNDNSRRLEPEWFV